MQRAMHDIQKDTNELTARTEDPVRTYAQAAAKAPPPHHHQSAYGSNRTAPAYPADLDRERAVTVKVGDSATAKNLRRLTNEDLVKHAEKHRRDAAKTAIRPTLFLRSAKEAEIARTHRDAWVRDFGETARVTLPTWGVVASDVPCKALGPLTDEVDRKRIAQELVANNRHAWGESCKWSMLAGSSVPHLVRKRPRLSLNSPRHTMQKRPSTRALSGTAESLRMPCTTGRLALYDATTAKDTAT
ncbi:hypothetical protein BDV35DRAFT_133964 [Aspergillus flavus]|uniref:Uncharacterized protein n=1 Tax=Aspergillus flavus TaxID=5059 RepID=A0A5N6GED5_ASPFL|nr:hypothetical protein BDV35DRAFT_133964 [Aspergillus flavus]